MNDTILVILAIMFFGGLVFAFVGALAADETWGAWETFWIGVCFTGVSSIIISLLSGLAYIGWNINIVEKLG